MVKFRCSCGHQFNVTDDKAGTDIQCPRCGILVAIPSASEALNLNEDGTYSVQKITPEPSRIGKLRHLYGRQKIDETGQDIDLRGPAEADEEQTQPPVPEPVKPKYDPETGQLIRAIDLSPEANVPPPNAEVPFAKVAPASVVKPEEEVPVGGALPLMQLMMPENIVSMFFVWLTHVLASLLLFAVIATDFLPLGIFIGILAAGIMAHVGNVMEELAVEKRDELPSFLRHFSLGDDVIRPFISVSLAIAVSFAPALIVFKLLTPWSLGWDWAVFSLAGIGAILFPAALLTTTTSGSIINARYDRLIGTITATGGRYFWCMLLLVATLAIYGGGVYMAMQYAHDLAAGIGLGKPPTNGGLVKAIPLFSFLVLGIYLMHYFLWELSIAYRAHHEEFPWLFQRYERDPAKDALPKPPKKDPAKLATYVAEGPENEQPPKPARTRMDNTHGEGPRSRPPNSRTRPPLNRPPTNPPNKRITRTN